MFSRRYTIVVADRGTGVVRRFTISLRPALIAVVTALGLPMLIGMGAAWKAKADVAHLFVAASTLELENANYRAATEALAGQIVALQTTMSDLGAQAALDPSLQNSMDKLPAFVKNSAMGGPGAGAALTSMTPGLTSPENTFGLLKDLLHGLESRLQLVRSDVNKRNQLAAATPSIWPTHGWLSSGMGNRSDPLTGEKDFHPGLDISADKGDPVYATADGKVTNASAPAITATSSFSSTVTVSRPATATCRRSRSRSARTSSAATCSAWSARPAAPPGRTCITRSAPTAASSIRSNSCSILAVAPRTRQLAKRIIGR